MIYKVRAKYKKDKASEFFEKLTDGTISSQKPDGLEIVESMHRAKITEPGIIEWFEMCFCNSPLQHEKATVYDHYLYDITTELVDNYGDVIGESFWSLLISSADKKEKEK